MAQIIDENAQVAEGLEDYLQSIGITSSGVDYHIISIIGPQSSGKSTLLNNLFHTSFETMNETTGRQQTTKGIHAAYSQGSKTLIFDIEGSDSRERGDADALFERKAALFALALSEVVMVNMWQNDIGRYNASGIPLLKTVFEVNLQLFASESKCHLLFVIRDSTTDVTVIEGQVKKDLEMVWSQLTLPQNLAGRPFEDFFIFHFVPLPHMRLKREDFNKSVVELANRFTSPDDKNFLFKELTGKIIPGDGLYQYIENVWESIGENKELNLPSQRRTLSSFRCDEFVKKSMVQFSQSIFTSIAEPLSSENNSVLNDFKEIAQRNIENTLKFYDDNAAKYVPDIVAEKRLELIAKFGEGLFVYYERNCHNAVIENEKKFVDYITNELPSDIRACEGGGYEQKARDKLRKCCEYVNEFVKNTIVGEYKWEYDTGKIETQLGERLDTHLDQLIKELEEHIFEERSSDYKSDVDKALKEAQPEMWSILRQKMKQVIKDTQDEIELCLKENTINRHCSQKLTDKYYRLTNKRVLIESRYVAQKMNFRFDEMFQQTESNGTKTRNWSSDTDISSIFEIARKAGLDILKMFSACQLREPGEPIPPNDILTQQMINPITVQGLEDKFNDAIEKTYIDAVRIRESKRIRNNIPWWMWALIVFFGYPKVIGMIKHPLWFVFYIVVGVTIFLLFKFGYLEKIIKYAKNYASLGATFVLKKIRGDVAPVKRERKSKKNNNNSNRNKKVSINVNNNENNNNNGDNDDNGINKNKGNEKKVDFMEPPIIRRVPQSQKMKRFSSSISEKHISVPIPKNA